MHAESSACSNRACSQLENPDSGTRELTEFTRWLRATRFYNNVIKLAACVERKPPTRNEIKYQACTMLEEAMITLPDHEASWWKERREKMEADEACTRYGNEGGI
jgi:hypothetical protein